MENAFSLTANGNVLDPLLEPLLALRQHRAKSLKAHLEKYLKAPAANKLQVLGPRAESNLDGSEKLVVSKEGQT